MCGSSQPSCMPETTLSHTAAGSPHTAHHQHYCHSNHTLGQYRARTELHCGSMGLVLSLKWSLPTQAHSSYWQCFTINTHTEYREVVYSMLTVPVKYWTVNSIVDNMLFIKTINENSITNEVFTTKWLHTFFFLANRPQLGQNRSDASDANSIGPVLACLSLATWGQWQHQCVYPHQRQEPGPCWHQDCSTVTTGAAGNSSVQQLLLTHLDCGTVSLPPLHTTRHAS